MEIINGNNRPAADCRRQYLGCVFIAAGLLWLLNNLDILGEKAFSMIFSWQTLLVLIGGYLLAVKARVAGWILIGIGAFFMVTQWLHIDLPVNKIVLPILIIVLGVTFLVRRK